MKPKTNNPHVILCSEDLNSCCFNVIGDKLYISNIVNPKIVPILLEILDRDVTIIYFEY